VLLHSDHLGAFVSKQYSHLDQPFSVSIIIFLTFDENKKVLGPNWYMDWAIHIVMKHLWELNWEIISCLLILLVNKSTWRNHLRKRERETGFNQMIQNDYLQIIKLLCMAWKKLYQQTAFRKFRLLSHCYGVSSGDRCINKFCGRDRNVSITKKERNDLKKNGKYKLTNNIDPTNYVIALGNWKHSQGHGKWAHWIDGDLDLGSFISLWWLIMLQIVSAFHRLLKQNNFQVVNVHERWTSQQCPICQKIKSKTKPFIEKDQQWLRGILRCNKCNTIFNRDVVGSLNIYHVARTHFDGNERPQYLEREWNHERINYGEVV
jgi:hypothetical protein